MSDTASTPIEGELLEPEGENPKKSPHSAPSTRARTRARRKPCTNSVHDQPHAPSKPCTNSVHDQQPLDGSPPQDRAPEGDAAPEQDRAPDDEDPAEIRRAVDRHRAYQLYVYERKSFREIERVTDIDRRLLPDLIREEAALRADERKALRAADIEKSTAVYEKVRDRSLERMDSDQAKGDEARYIIAAQERIDKLHGYDEPIKFADGEPGSERLVSVFAKLDPQARAALLGIVAAKRLAPPKPVE